MLKIIIKEEVTQEMRNLFEHIKREHSDIVEGIYDLYDSLAMNGYCISYKEERIYYVAYTLADQNISFIIE